MVAPNAEVHDHNHDGSEGHSHDHAPSVGDANEKRVLWALLLTGSFMIIEVVGGLLSGSLALLADAGHMLADTAALGLAWAAFRIAKRPHDTRRSYGYHRFQVLAAFINGLTLLLIVIWIVVEAVRRLVEPVEVLGVPMLAVASAGLVVNIVAYAILHRGASENMNVQGAALHVLGDLLGSVAAIAAAVVILWTGWMPIDPLLSVLVALLILNSVWRLIRRSAHILLEGAPDWIDETELKAQLTAAVPAVESVHHLHVWMLTQEHPMITMHAQVSEAANHNEVLVAITRFLSERFAITHATIQIETGDCVDDIAAVLDQASHGSAIR
ncbi:MAG: cation diffusion facilitator family transporter [Alphaproteobacteria bacterium]|nr:cation diffusion facilitator family transporter [Alphaproteobacteria bacterium]